MDKIKLPKQVLEFFQKTGAKGGSAKSEKKTIAARNNARKPRKKSKSTTASQAQSKTKDEAA